VGELTLSIVAHALLGIALALLIWAVGAGWLRLLGRLTPPFAYPIGLLAVAAAAWLLLVSVWLAPVSIVLIAPAALARLRLAPFVHASPFALALGIALGVLLHGPTSEEDSHAYGDLLFYAAKLVSAHESVIPFRDLLVEGDASTYIEAASTFIGGALDFLPGLDPVLFQAATAPAFLVAAFAAGVSVARIRVAPWQVAALAPLAAAVVAYPTWITESPPVAFALPLAFAVDALVRDRLELGELALAVVVVALGFVLTKGFALVPLTVAAAFALATQHRRELDTRRILRYGLPTLAVGLAALVFFVATSAWLTEVLGAKFLPADAVDGLADQLDRRDTQAVAPAFLVVGELLLAAALARGRAWPQLALMVAAIAGSWFVGGHGFDITVAIAIVVALLELARRPELLRAQLPLVVAAGAALAASVVCRDISGVRVGFMLALLLGAGVLAALAPPRALVPIAVAAALGVGVTAPAISQGPPTLTREDHDVWAEVRERVPDDGLVFTSETGPEITGTQGWNYYPGVAGRQVYLAGWSSSPLLVDEAELARRLALNRAVLDGRDPRTIPLDRSYGSFYAVVESDAPPAWRPLYANERFGLYEIP
jgi:hypothetical protein